MQTPVFESALIGKGVAIIGALCLGTALIMDYRLWFGAIKTDKAGFLCTGIGLIDVYPDLNWLLPYWLVVGIFVSLGTAVNSYIRVKLRNKRINQQA